MWAYCAFFAFSASAAPQNVDGHVVRVVERVIDGDTIELSGGEKVRLIGVDAPESQYSYKLYRDANSTGETTETIQALGNLSARFVEQLVSGKEVVLGFDQVNAPRGHRDRFGRLLAYVNLIDKTGQPVLCINDVILDAGYANVYSRYPFGRLTWYREAESSAREGGRGLWAPDALTGTDARKLLTTDDVLYVTKTGAKYHRANCRSLRHSRIPLDPNGHAGKYTACKICKPVYCRLRHTGRQLTDASCLPLHRVADVRAFFRRCP